MNIVDLHVHSIKSDGSLTPSELVEHAISKGLVSFALTDHDTIDGIEEALDYAKDKNIEVIPGIELSTEYLGKDVHIVGLYIDISNVTFLNHLRKFRDSRDTRNEKMCANLREAGIDITFEKLKAENPDSVITRSHYAKYLLAHGYIKSLKEAFDKYVGDNCKYYVPREKITPAEAISLILEAGGIPILAHPVLYHFSDRVLDELVKQLKNAGLIGIEAIYSTYSPSEERDIRRLAKKYDLCISGGSDFHGKAKPGLDLATGYGKLFIPEEVLINLKARKKSLSKPKKIFFTDMDNTLLTTDKRISQKTKDILNKWLSKGNYLAFSSGRPLDSVLSVIRENDFLKENVYAIGYNGSLVHDVISGENIIEKTLSLDVVNQIAKIAKENDIYCHTYEGDTILIPREGDEISFYTKTVKLPYRVLSDFPEGVTKPPYKMLCVETMNIAKLDIMIAKLKESGIKGIITLKSNDHLLEIFSDKSGKGTAVKELCNFLNIDIRDSIGAGDQQNDISMIQAAGLGIAMCNGTEDVKLAADVITQTDNNNDGLVPFLENAML